MLPKPKVDDIIEQRNRLEGVYSDLKTKIELVDKLLSNKYDAGVPDPFKTVRSARPHSIVDDIKNAIIPCRPTAKIKSRSGATGDHEKNAERAKRREDFINAFFEYNEKHSRLPVLTDATRKLAKYGMACLKVEPNLRFYLNKEDKFSSEEWEDRKRSVFPFSFRSIHPYNVLADVRSEDPMYVIEYCQKTYQDIIGAFPNFSLKEDKNLWDTVSWTAYYDADWRCYLVDNEPVLPDGGVIKNPCGFQPYIIFFSGYGDLDAEGNPASLAVGTLEPIIDKLIRETRLDSQEDAIMAVWAWGAKMVNPASADQIADPTALKAFVNELTLAPGQINQNPHGYQIVNVLETLGGEINAIRSAKLMNIDDIERATFAKVMRGVGEEGSGVKNIALIEQGKQKFTPLADAMTQAMQRVVANVLRIVENAFEQRVYIGNTSITPDDIKGEYDCETNLMPPTLTEKMTNSEWALNLYVHGGLDMETVLERSGVDNAREIMVKRMAEDVAREIIPQISQTALAEMAEEMRKANELRALKEARKSGVPLTPPPPQPPMSQGMGQGGMMPPMPQGGMLPPRQGGPFG